MFAVGTIYARARSVEPEPGTASTAWLEAAGVEDGAAFDDAARIDIVERLALIGEPWCRQVLEDAYRQEADRSVKAAAKKALRAIRQS